jgi:hypothetical protein
MYKVKDSVDLKELEKFRFDKENFSYTRDEKLSKSGNEIVTMIDKNNKKIFTYILVNGLRFVNPQKYIQDLIKADLIEKIEE